MNDEGDMKSSLAHAIDLMNGDDGEEVDLIIDLTKDEKKRKKAEKKKQELRKSSGTKEKTVTPPVKLKVKKKKKQKPLSAAQALITLTKGIEKPKTPKKDKEKKERAPFDFGLNKNKEEKGEKVEGNSSSSVLKPPVVTPVKTALAKGASGMTPKVENMYATAAQRAKTDGIGI